MVADDNDTAAGMTRSQVHNVTGISGTTTDTTTFEDGWSELTTVSYRQCKANGQPASAYDTVSMIYQNYAFTEDYDSYPVPAYVYSRGDWWSV